MSLWIGTLLTTAAVIATGAMHFNPAVAFDLPPGGFSFSVGFLFGLGAASRIGIYDYLGYFSVAYIGDEVRDPGRVIPRSILISVVAVARSTSGINLSVIGVVPWREFVPAADHPQADFIVSAFMERVYGARVATFFTALVLWTAFGSVFALLLGYSRIPYAAALDGTFFRVFGRLHPTKRFPHVSLLLTGVIAIAASTLSLGMVIDALITTRILVQFIGQVVALTLLRRNAPDMPRPVQGVALPAAEPRGAVRLDLPVRHLRLGRHRLRPRHVAARRGRVLRVGLAHRDVALRQKLKGSRLQALGSGLWLLALGCERTESQEPKSPEPP